MLRALRLSAVSVRSGFAKVAGALRVRRIRVEGRRRAEEEEEEETSTQAPPASGEVGKDAGPRQRGEPSQPAEASVPPRADERTIRRIAEAQRGGLSSEDSFELYTSGLNPGGLHHKARRAVTPEEGAALESDEPEEREPRTPGPVRHMPSHRRQ